MQKILFIIESLSCGGAEKSLVTLLQNIDYSKFEVDLLLIKKGGEFENLVPKEVTIIYKNIFENYSKLNYNFNRFKFWWLKKIDFTTSFNDAQHFWKAFGNGIAAQIKKYDVAIAYSQGFATYFAVEKVVATKKFSWLNTDYQKVGFNIQFDYPFYKKMSAIVAVSPESKQSIENALNSIDKNLVVKTIKDISDVKIINQLSTAATGFSYGNNDINVLTVCRLSKEKGLHLAVEACEILVQKNKNLKWFVIGEGAERPFLEALIVQKKLQDHFFLLGFHQNPYPFVKTCSVYVQTSLFEGLGLSVIEAAILNKPIVCTNFLTAPTILFHNQTGLICEMTAQSVAENIQIFIDNTEFKDKIVFNLQHQKNNDMELSLAQFDALLFG